MAVQDGQQIMEDLGELVPELSVSLLSQVLVRRTNSKQRRPETAADQILHVAERVAKIADAAQIARHRIAATVLGYELKDLDKHLLAGFQRRRHVLSGRVLFQDAELTLKPTEQDDAVVEQQRILSVTRLLPVTTQATTKFLNVHFHCPLD